VIEFTLSFFFRPLEKYMKIISIYLKGFRPLLLAKIDSIELSIDKMTTLIIGTNGCGKSSLLREATPFPAQPSNYLEEGEKRIKIEHNGHLYELISILSKNGKHTFIKDGIDVHSNANASVHMDMVVKEFNYTPLVHKLLIGELKFTDMSVSERRNILTEISPLELQYAITLHNKAKESLRDSHAVLKHLVNKSTDAQTKLKQLDIPEDTDSKQQELEQQLNSLIPFTTQKLPSSNATFLVIESLYAEMNQIKNQLLKFDDTRVPTEGINSVDELNEYIGTCIGKLSAIQTLINDLTKEASELSDLTHSFDGTVPNASHLQNEIKEIKGSLNSIPVIELGNDDCLEYIPNLHFLANEISNLFLFNTPIRTSEECKDILDGYNYIEARLTRTIQSISNLTDKLEHYNKDLETITCPKCTHEFNLKGISIEDTIKEIEQSIINVSKIKADLMAELEILRPQAEEVNELYRLLTKIGRMKKEINLPFSFWDKFNSNLEILKNPSLFLNHICKWEQNIDMHSKRLECTKRLKYLETCLTTYDKYNGQVNERVITIENSINHYLNEKKLLNEQINTCKLILKNVTNYSRLQEQGNNILKRLSEQFKLATDSLIQEDAKKQCEQLYNDLATIKGLLNKRNHLTNTIKELEDEYKKVLFKQKGWLVVEENLSPKTGIIADEMLGFITSYVDSINLIIKQVWAYTLKVEACNMDNGALSYTFPFKSTVNTIKDIALGSQSQQEIINLSFMIVMREYLNLHDYPVYLDETGATFDYNHRTSLYSYIKTFIDMKLCSQVFMVNHYNDIITGLSNHDIVVIDNRNVIVPDVYNEKTTITYL